MNFISPSYHVPVKKYVSGIRAPPNIQLTISAVPGFLIKLVNGLGIKNCLTK